MDTEILVRNFRLYFKSITKRGIKDTIDNKKLLTRQIDKDNSYDFDLQEINDFF